MKWRHQIWSMGVCLLVASAWAGATTWNVMDWIDGRYETSTPFWQQQLGVDRVMINCSDLTIRTTPQDCVSWIQQNPVPGITTYVPFINPSSSTLLTNASLFSSLTVGVPSIPEIDIDDFLSTWESWSDTMPDAPQFLNQFVSNLKSNNSRLKFGITLYEDELGSSYLSDSRMPPTIRARFDVIRLFLHYRMNGPNYANYVALTKAAFPNAQVIAGVYAYDRIDYWPCSPMSHASCTQAQELAYFQQALNIQIQLMQQDQVNGLDIYPGYFGNETALYGSGPTNDQLTCHDVTRCLNNTITMREEIQTAHKGYEQSQKPQISTVTQIPVKIYPNPWRSDQHTGLPITFEAVAAGSQVKIFTISGQWVKTLYATTNSVSWDLKNDSGHLVASGIYLYLLTNENGNTVHGQLVIIK